LLLLDLNVPRRTGDEVLRRIKRSPKCANIPVIVITSSDSREDRQKASELGADEYFRKPSNLTEFLELGKLVRRLTQRVPQEAD
jgi:DNA-binding response OmpR family regulator